MVPGNNTDDPDGKIDHNNPYFFQGKRLDLLDAGGLELMSWPYRDYLTYLGRWLQPEKLGVIPNDNQQINPFSVRAQYTDGLNLYGHLASNPVSRQDPMGLLPPVPPWGGPPPKPVAKKCGNCGVDVSFALTMLQLVLPFYYGSLSPAEQAKRCSKMVSTNGWEIHDLHHPYSAPMPRGCGDCQATVAIYGNCYSIHEVNYFLWGAINRICGNSLAFTTTTAFVWASVGARCVAAYGGISCEGTPGSKTNWAKVGYTDNFGLLTPASSEFSDCKVSSGGAGWGGFFNWKWGW